MGADCLYFHFEGRRLAVPVVRVEASWTALFLFSIKLKMHNKMDTDVQKKEEKGVTLLDNLYRFVIAGVPSLSEPVEELAGYYLTHHPDNPEIAIKNFILNQKMKCSTTGFLTGLGGLITLPVTLPADLASSLYMELRMIAGIAYIRGYDLKDDTVKTLLYLCLVGNAAGDVIKQVGIKISGRYTLKKILPKLSREILVKINKAVGFRLVTKGGTKGVINLAKMVPLLGGVVGATFNWYEVALYAKIAKRMFEENKI